jgi:MFS family permease
MGDRRTREMVTALGPIYGITLVDVLGYMIMIPLLPYIAQRYDASGVVVGALLATIAVASVLAAPLWGALSDRVGRKPVVLVSQPTSPTRRTATKPTRCSASSSGSAS